MPNVFTTKKMLARIGMLLRNHLIHKKLISQLLLL